MGKFIKRFKHITNKVDDSLNNKHFEKKDPKPNFSNKKLKMRETESIDNEIFDGIDDGFDDINFNKNINGFDDYDVGIQPAQKPESFHHFILENQYKDLEKSIRGYKDVYNKSKQDWETKRKLKHCFTDEEAEEILRTAQSLLATDIKLSFINKEVFGMRVMMIYKRLKQLFREIAEYRYGRYSHYKEGDIIPKGFKIGDPIPGGYAIEQEMKLQNLKIFLELTERIVANYSRAIAGVENKLTHQSVSAQESLQSSDRFDDRNKRYS